MVLIVTSFVVLLQSARSQLRLPTLVITEENYEDCGEAATCPATAEEVGNLRRMIENVLNTTFAHPCGDGLWNRVAYLNMSDPSQRCPSNWLEYSNNSLGVRACRREPSPGAGSCSGVLFSSSKQQYSKVCGKVIGYQFGTTDAFTDPFSNIRSDVSINGSYVDGVSITHSTMPRNHIWSFASGVTEAGLSRFNCPCSPGYQGPVQPSYVGNDYFCESGDSASASSTFHLDDKLWDGQQCSNEGSCCTNKTLPWFHKELPNPTSDDIEVRICGDEGTETEGTPVELIEIYVQ